MQCKREGPTLQSSFGKCTFKLCAACYRGILKNNEHYENILPASDCEEFEEEPDDPIDLVADGTSKTDDAAFTLVAMYETSGSIKGSKYGWISPYVETVQGTPMMMKYYPQVHTLTYVLKVLILF